MDRPSPKDEVEKKELLKVVTFNAKNIETIKVYINTLLNSCDILAIQEHWLFNFHLPEIEKMFSSHSSFQKGC